MRDNWKGWRCELESWSVRAVLLGVSLIACFLLIYGIGVGVPSAERLDVSLGGPEGVERGLLVIQQALSTKISDRSEFLEIEKKGDLAAASPYFDQLRSFFPDEGYAIKVLGRMARDKDPLPRSYIYGPFFIYQIGAGVGAAKACGFLGGGTDVVWFMKHPGQFAPAYVAARLVCAACAVAAVGLTFLIGLRLGGMWLGTVGALLLACMPMTVLAGKYVKSDAPAMCWATCALFFAVPVLARTQWKDYLLSGVCVGLAAGCKYPAAITGLYLAAFHIAKRLTDDRQQPRFSFQRCDLMLVGGGVASIVAFVVCCPSFFLDWNVFWKDVLWTSVAMESSFIDNLMSFLREMCSHTMGPFALFASICGVVLAFVRPHKAWTAMAVAFLGFGAFVCLGSMDKDYYLLTVYPAMCLLAARAVLMPKSGLVKCLLCVGMLLSTFSYSLAYCRCAAAENTRVTAARWMNENIPEGSSIGSWKYPVGYRIPMVSPTRYSLRSSDFNQDTLMSDYFVEGSWEWIPQTFRRFLAGEKDFPNPALRDYRVLKVFESPPRAFFGLLPLSHDRRLSPFIEVVSPKIFVYKRNLAPQQ